VQRLPESTTDIFEKYKNKFKKMERVCGRMFRQEVVSGVKKWVVTFILQ
jgi:hypothetical protein